MGCEMIIKSQVIETAYFMASLANFAAPANLNYPVGWTIAQNSQNWVTNAGTQSAAIPLVIIPDEWVYRAKITMLWVSGATALATTSVFLQLRDVANSLAVSTLQIAAPLLIANQGVKEAIQPFDGRALTGVKSSQLSVRTSNTDANTINVTAELYITAFRIV